RWSSKDIDTPLPSAVKNQLAGDAVGIYKKARKEDFKRIPVLKKPVCVWNNQNYSFDFESISFPVWMDGKSVKMRFRAPMVDKDNRNTRLLANKLGTLRVTKKGRKWIAQISVHVPTV
ncbi:transposase, partial [Exiguobacterium sp. TBG-PICH-001]|nr:transposase [Exiguobacterium sp. TBG-PICH-001]